MINTVPAPEVTVVHIKPLVGSNMGEERVVFFGNIVFLKVISYWSCRYIANEREIGRAHV